MTIKEIIDESVHTLDDKYNKQMNEQYETEDGKIAQDAFKELTKAFSYVIKDLGAFDYEVRIIFCKSDDYTFTSRDKYGSSYIKLDLKSKVAYELFARLFKHSNSLKAYGLVQQNKNIVFIYTPYVNG